MQFSNSETNNCRPPSVLFVNTNTCPLYSAGNSVHRVKYIPLLQIFGKLSHTGPEGQGITSPIITMNP